MAGFRTWRNFEEGFCKEASIPEGAQTDHNAALFRSIVHSNDARQAEALILQGEADPLLRLRGLIFRGKLEEAKQLASALEKESESQDTLAEIFLEQARISAMNADWLESERICSEALSLTKVAPVSQLTLFQIRSLSRYELGKMVAAMEDLHSLFALASLFPNTPSAYYGEILRIKIVALDQGLEKAQVLLRDLWKRFAKNPNTVLDRVHALIRCELDLQRLAGKPNAGTLLTSYLIAETSGERLYSALASLEAAHSGYPLLKNHFEPMLKEVSEFPRLKKLLEEIDGTAAHSSTTGHILAESSKFEFPDSQELARILNSEIKIEVICLLSQGMLLKLNPFKLESLATLKQISDAVDALSKGPMDFETFFAEVWGNTKYTPHLHDSLISTLLHRMKRRNGIIAKVLGGKIRLENTLVVK